MDELVRKSDELPVAAGSGFNGGLGGPGEELVCPPELRIEALEKLVAYWKSEAEWRKNNMEHGCLWPSTLMESDELMPDGKPQKLAVVPNWCIEKIKRNA